MIVYLDFDGTLVEFAYPRIGISNLRWKPVLRSLIDADYEIVVNTARIHDDQYGSMEAAMLWLQKEFPGISKHTSRKIHPPKWNPIKGQDLYIDDIAENIPLMTDSRKRPLVHWGNVRLDLKKAKII